MGSWELAVGALAHRGTFPTDNCQLPAPRFHMKLFVGLGNPGEKYARHRHNVGFMAVERIAERHRFGPWKRKFQGLAADGEIAGEKVLLLKPDTYMNEFGRAVGDAARFLKIAEADVVAFHDELDLAPGQDQGQGRRRQCRPQWPALDHRPHRQRLRARAHRHRPSRRQGAGARLRAARLRQAPTRPGWSRCSMRSPTPPAGWRGRSGPLSDRCRPRLAASDREQAGQRHWASRERRARRQAARRPSRRRAHGQASIGPGRQPEEMDGRPAEAGRVALQGQLERDLLRPPALGDRAGLRIVALLQHRALARALAAQDDRHRARRPALLGVDVVAAAPGRPCPALPVVTDSISTLANPGRLPSSTRRQRSRLSVPSTTPYSTQTLAWSCTLPVRPGMRTTALIAKPCCSST